MNPTKDVLIRGTALDGKVRALAAVTTEAVDTISKRQDTWATATAALGRTLTMGALMGAMLKGEERLTIQVKGDGPLGQIVVDANAHGEIRGYVDHPHVDLPDNAMGKFDVAGAVGTEGFIYVIKDLGMREPYRGSTPIVSGELAEDFTYYFAKSEQTPSAVALGVLVDVDYSVRAAGGFVIQLLPGLSEDEIADIEQQLSEIPPVTKLLDEGLGPEQIVQKILPSFRMLDSLPVSFRCKCSRERIDQTLISMGKYELQSLIDEEGKAEVVCHFCNEAYDYDRKQLEALLDQL